MEVKFKSLETRDFDRIKKNSAKTPPSEFLIFTREFIGEDIYRDGRKQMKSALFWGGVTVDEIKNKREYELRESENRKSLRKQGKYY